MEKNFYNENPYFQAIDSFIANIGIEKTFRYSKSNYTSVYVIKVEMPGYKKENITIYKKNNNIKVVGLSNKKRKSQLIHVPFNISNKKTKAIFKNGLLVIFIAKEKTKSITID
jgi:HSP20 family molecular chaperone IbpA